MKENAAIALLVMLAVTGWAAAAAAVEGGWFETVDELERLQERADADAETLQQRAAEIDEHLDELLTDASAARSIERELRRDVAMGVVRWDADRRRAARAEWTLGPGAGEAMRLALEASGLPATKRWRRDVRLVDEWTRGAEHADALLVRRAGFEVRYGHQRALSQSAEAGRQWVLERASDDSAKEEIDEERDDIEQVLAAELERLRAAASEDDEDDFHRRKGALLPPVRATPDHLYGPRQREGSYTEVRHTGVTYMIDAGTEVSAVAAGTVVMADRMPGYGKVVIVDHGDDYHSLYAHLEDIEVDVGDELPGRETIGTSGESGSLEGPKLYFELRRQGRPVDPEKWFVSE